jgi:hypothetical protein
MSDEGELMTGAQHRFTIKNPKLPSAMPVWATPVSSKIASVHSAFKQIKDR